MSAKPITENTLFYGDNLKVLREYIPDESVDLIDLDQESSPLSTMLTASRSASLSRCNQGMSNPSGDIRDLRGTVKRENAAIGVFITLEPPSKDMITEAVTAGFYESPHWKKCPRIQILTVGDLLKGAKVDMPPQYGTFKQAQRVKQDETGIEQSALFESERT